MVDFPSKVVNFTCEGMNLHDKLNCVFERDVQRRKKNDRNYSIINLPFPTISVALIS